MKSEYYYSQMTRLQQSVYRQIYDGMTQLSPSFSVTALPMAELSDLWFRLRLDHPMIFYVTSFRCRKTAGADTVLSEPEYMFEKEDSGAPEKSGSKDYSPDPPHAISVRTGEGYRYS